MNIVRKTERAHTEERPEGASRSMRHDRGADQPCFETGARKSGLPDLRMMAPISGKPEIGCALLSMRAEQHT
jgi:hypothetical protein